MNVDRQSLIPAACSTMEATAAQERSNLWNLEMQRLQTQATQRLHTRTEQHLRHIQNVVSWAQQQSRGDASSDNLGSLGLRLQPVDGTSVDHLQQHVNALALHHAQLQSVRMQQARDFWDQIHSVQARLCALRRRNEHLNAALDRFNYVAPGNLQCLWLPDEAILADLDMAHEEPVGRRFANPLAGLQVQGTVIAAAEAHETITRANGVIGTAPGPLFTQPLSHGHPGSTLETRLNSSLRARLAQLEYRTDDPEEIPHSSSSGVSSLHSVAELIESRGTVRERLSMGPSDITGHRAVIGERISTTEIQDNHEYYSVLPDTPPVHGHPDSRRGDEDAPLVRGYTYYRGTQRTDEQVQDTTRFEPAIRPDVHGASSLPHPMSPRTYITAPQTPLQRERSADRDRQEELLTSPEVQANLCERYPPLLHPTVQLQRQVVWVPSGGESRYTRRRPRFAWHRRNVESYIKWSMAGQVVAIFDWRTRDCASQETMDTSPNIRLMQEPGHEYSSAIHVDLSMLGTVGIDRIDQIVGVELEHAVRKDQIDDALARDLWKQWLGNGKETMEFSMSGDD